MALPDIRIGNALEDSGVGPANTGFVIDMSLVAGRGNDDTAAIIAAVAALPVTGGILDFRGGTFLLSGSGALVTFTRSGTKLLCEGATFVITPTGNCTAFTATGSGGFPLSGFVIDGEPTFQSADTTFTKTMLSLIDVSGARIRIAAPTEGAWYDVGLTSIGIHTFGRDLSEVSSAKGIAAPRPIVISRNPNSGIDLDFWKMQNILLIANGHPNIDIEDCYLSNSVFRNISCNKGTYGIKATGSTNPNASTNNLVENVRWEQGTGATGYAIDWALSITRNLEVRSCAATSTGARGFRFRNASTIKLAQCEYPYTDIAVDADASCDHLDLDLNFFQATSTYSASMISEMRNTLADGVSTSQPSPGAIHEHWINAANPTRYVTINGVNYITYEGVLNAGATFPLSDITSTNAQGHIRASFTGAGGDGGGSVVLTPAGTFSAGVSANFSAGNVAAKFCVVFGGPASVLLLNNLAAAVTYLVTVEWLQ